MKLQTAAIKTKITSIIMTSIVIISIGAFNTTAIEPPTIYIDDDFTLEGDWWGYIVVDTSGTSEDWITINLNGYKVYANGAGIGIKIDGKHHVEIISYDGESQLNGYIEDFYTGIEIRDSYSISIGLTHSLYIEDCYYGLYIYT